MALPRRRSRLVHVHGVAFRWLVSPHWRFEVNAAGERWRREIDYLDLYAERRLHGTSQLRVRLRAAQLRSWGRDPEQRSAIDPPLVRRAVRYALDHGWHPEAPDAPRRFPLDPFAQRFLQTPRHLLYAEPLIARVCVNDIRSGGRGRALAAAQIIEPLRGNHAGQTLQVAVHQPSAHLPPDGMIFVHPDPRPDPEVDGPAFTDQPRMGGLFRVASEAVFLYDNSGEDHRWAFLPLQELRQELVDIYAPLTEDEADPPDGEEEEEEEE